MKIKYLFSVSLLLIISLIVSCKSNPKLIINDNWYLMDNYAILLLCEAPPEDKDYIKSISKLSGNEDELNVVLMELKKQGNDVKTLNAIGVTYLRLRQFDEAETVLIQAFQNAVTEDEKVCVSTNLSETEKYKDNQEKRYKYALSADEACVTNPLKKLVVKSNLIRVEMERDEYGAPYNVKAKALLQEEKRLLGSNQLIGIQNYKILALGCYYDGQLKSSIKYMQKALELNKASYNSLSIEGDLYNTMSYIYVNQPNKAYYNEALDYASKYINTLERWQVPNCYDLMTAYEWRGNIYLNMDETEKALGDYQLVLSRSKDQSFMGVSYYNMAYAYLRRNDVDKGVNAFSKAYLILKKEKTKQSMVEDIEHIMKSIYDTNNYKNLGIDYKNWFSLKMEAARKQLTGEVQNEQN